MKKIIVFSISILASIFVKAQQENHYTMFTYNKMMYNPAFAGARDVGSVWGLYRNQWMGFKGAPQSQLIGFDSPLGKTRTSIGAAFSHHRIGIQRDLIANLAYSYGIINTPKMSLKLGIGGSYRNFSYDINNPNLYIRDGISGDDVLATVEGIRSNHRGNVGAGLFFAYKDFYVGASVPNIYQSKLVNVSDAKQLRHYYAFAGGMFPMGDKMHLKPALSARYVKGAALSFDSHVGLMFNRKFTVGANYRLDSQVQSEAVSGVMYFQMSNRVGFGASYDYTLSKLSNFNNGSIEAILRYDFGIAKENVSQNFDNPRYFY
jgi:type IX secretion system PorP/SprF family membrane protein